MCPFHICRPNDYTIEKVFCFKFSFTTFLLMFLPLFSNVITNILKIYELLEIYKTLKKNVHDNHLPGQFYVTTWSGFWSLFKTYTWGQRTLLALNKKKILVRIYVFLNVVPKESFFFVAPDFVPILYNKPCICTR